MSASRRQSADVYAAGRAHLYAADPVLAELIDRHPDFDPAALLEGSPERDAFSGLVMQIVGQQISFRAATAILNRIRDLYGGQLPSAEEVLHADAAALRAAGVSARKLDTIRAGAEAFADGRISDELLAASTDDEVEQLLTVLPGVGPWTVHGLLIILGRPDVLPVGDLALRRAIGDIYALDETPTAPQVAVMGERWRPHRSLAASYILAAGSGSTA